jgi:hypothetical protein
MQDSRCIGARLQKGRRRVNLENYRIHQFFRGKDEGYLDTFLDRFQLSYATVFQMREAILSCLSACGDVTGLTRIFVDDGRLCLQLVRSHLVWAETTSSGYPGLTVYGRYYLREEERLLSRRYWEDSPYFANAD